MYKTKAPRYFGDFGGMFVPEILMPALLELEAGFIAAKQDQSFQSELSDLLNNYAGRPTPITLCRNFSPNKNVNIYLKREDLLHGGAHKTNQVLAQALLAKRLGKTNIIAETGAGQHGVATALAGALLGLPCRIYMGQKDMARQSLNVFRMRLMGAEVIAVTSGAGTLKEAVNEALRDWSASYETSHYLLGTAAGPHPYPTMVRDFQCIIGQEARQQMLNITGKLPTDIFACVGGGSNAIGMFHAFIGDENVKLWGAEPGGQGLSSGKHGAALSTDSFGVLHGAYTAVMQDQYGQIETSYSLSAGLDYPAVGPEHAYLKKIGRANYQAITDDRAVAAFSRLAKTEGIIPALESAHALALCFERAQMAGSSADYLVCLSGRGDKDLNIVADYLQKT